MLRSRGLGAQAHAQLLSSKASGQPWEWMKSVGYEVNPCNSSLHPAVEEGLAPSSPERSVQEAYTPESTCYGCGPGAPDGLKMRSFRIPNGLQANVMLADKYCAFPNIINGGIISTLFDCHGNWTAAIALMDRSVLPRPPLTLTFELLVNFKEPTPPGQPLVVRSQVAKLKGGAEVPGSGKATVQVDMTLHQLDPSGRETLLATGTGLFKKVGAMRAL